MTVSVIVITYKRLEELKKSIECLLEEKDTFQELILVDNHSQDGTKEYGTALAEKEEKVKFYSLEENKGVAGGRNYAIKKATGDLLVFLDDDAFFAEKGYIGECLKKMQSDEKIGAMAFRIINFYTKEMRTEEIPFTNKKLDMNRERLASMFIGAGHAIRSEVLEKTGLYPEDYFYGVEELDLSFRIIDEGYQIIYDPAIRVFHKQHVAGRVSNKNKWIRSYRNRMITAYRYLGGKYQFVLGILLFAKIAILSHGISAPWQGFCQFCRDKKNVNKQRVKKETILYLKENYGRLWI